MKNKLKFYRKKRGFTQERMANSISVSRQTYINYESIYSSEAIDEQSRFKNLVKYKVVYFDGKNII